MPNKLKPYEPVNIFERVSNDEQRRLGELWKKSRGAQESDEDWNHSQPKKSTKPARNDDA